MNEEVNDFLARFFRTDKEDVKKLIQTDYATDFLILWSLFESKCFMGFMKYEAIQQKNLFEMTDIQFKNITKKFHDRYKDSGLWKNLCHKCKKPEMDTLLTVEFSTLSDMQITQFGIFVVYRYRNNIFHGSKSVRSWLAFEQQIKDCIQLMILYMNAQNISDQTVAPVLAGTA